MLIIDLYQFYQQVRPSSLVNAPNNFEQPSSYNKFFIIFVLTLTVSLLLFLRGQ